jgi:hypothetical protein
MAVANGYGKVVTSGSVFMYDTGDTVNSYIGEPTTNYQWNSGYEVTPWTVGGINTDVTNTVDQGPIKGAKTWKFQKTGTSNQWNGWESSYGGIWSGNSGDIWTTSYWYKTNNDAGMGGFWIGAFYTPDWSRPYNTTVLANVSSIIPDGQWHYNYTVTRFNENYSNAIIVDGPSWGYSGQAGELYVNGLQWEKKSHPTPFAYGTRSATQGLLPLISNSTLNLSNVSFDSNAQITFDGTDDKIDSGYDLSWNNTNKISIEFLLNPSTISGGNYGIMGKQYPDWEWAFYQNGTSLYLVYWSTAGGHANGMDFSVPAFGTANVWYHVVYTWDGSTSIFYINGTLAGSKNADNPSINQNRSNNVMLGGNTYVWGDSYWSGKLNMVKFYNRNLSITEVKQNYNKYKTRFNLS